MSDTFRTVDGRGRATIEQRGSRFIGIVEGRSSVAAAETFLDEIREEHADATHVVPAYRIRVDDGSYLREYSSDAGEPSGSAGAPALNVLQGESLENVAVCVVRHYGGTNLGVGGLVSAYGDTVKRALDAAGTTVTRPKTTFTVSVEYDDSGAVRGILESAAVTFDARYEERAHFDVEAPTSTAADLRDRIRSATSGRATLDECGD